jgi:hypothetical protein
MTAFPLPGEGSAAPRAGRPRQGHPSWHLVECLSDLTGTDLTYLLLGETLSIPERLVVSPGTGRFAASEPTLSDAARGAQVHAGQRLGRVGDLEVSSLFSGQLMGLLAKPGERVVVGQPLAWVRT